MKVIKFLPFLLIVMFFATACNDDRFFEEEQYKKVFSILSEGNYNIFESVHDLDKGITTGYVSSSMGGTLPSKQEVKIKFELDMDLLDNYNIVNYDIDYGKYARILPANRYTIADYNMTIGAGERGASMPIEVNAEGLSPDSTYFIPLNVAYYSGYEIHPVKNNVLFRVLMKNRFAEQKPVTNYNLRAFRGTVQIPGTKTVHPIGKNKVRIFVDNVAFQANKSVIDKNAITLEVLDDNKVLIKPYKNMVVNQIDGDPDFPNIFFIEDNGFKKYKVFLIRYSYVNASGATIQMKEELRVEMEEK